MDFPPVTLWNGDTEAPPPIWWDCGSPVRPEPRHPELQLDEERVLVLDGDPGPPDDWPVFWEN